jgi:hypothetical protein
MGGDRMRRGSVGGLAAALLAGAVLVCGALPGMIHDRGPALTVRDAGGALLATIPLPADKGFALRYRNSLYGTLAEERFVVAEQGQMRLVELAADQLAVLEEYYTVTHAERAPRGSRRPWVAGPAMPVALDELSIAATDLGERTLLVAGRPPLPLWQLVEDDPTVVLQVEGTGS